MRVTYLVLTILMTAGTITAQEHRVQLRNVLDAQRRLQIDVEALVDTIDRELAIAQRLYDAVVSVNDPQEHNGAERAMEHVRAARRLSEEGDESIHLRGIIAEATQMIENHRDWIHSSDLYEVHERYHHTVIHPLSVELAEDLLVLQELVESGLASRRLESIRHQIDQTQLRLLRYSDIRYE